MESKIKSRERIERQLLDAVNSCRAGILDTFEMELGEETNWGLVRGRLLRAFGDRGLAGRVLEILNTELDRSQNGNGN